jgi:hypothetical protein
MGEVQRFFEPVTEWMMERLPQRAPGYTLDLDSTVFERHGQQQEGATKGYNPRRRGRPSHHPLLAILAEAHFVMHAWLRSGNCGTARGVTEFLKEALALWGERAGLRRVRADSGFFEGALLDFLEQRKLSYIVAARMTTLVKREAVRVSQWRALDESYAVGEFRVQLWGWSKVRRFVVVRERLQDSKPAVGKKLIDLPGYSMRVFVTDSEESPEVIWRDYNKRADMENRIAELKHDPGADRFCLREFHASEAVFRSILLLFNLLSEFQRAGDTGRYQEPGTLRSQVLLCGAEMSVVGQETVLFLSTCWGGLKRRIAMFQSILNWQLSISPKLQLAATG